MTREIFILHVYDPSALNTWDPWNFASEIRKPHVSFIVFSSNVTVKFGNSESLKRCLVYSYTQGIRIFLPPWSFLILEHFK